MEKNASSSGETSQLTLSMDSVSVGHELFGDLANPKKEVHSVVKRWLREIYSKNKENGEYSLVELVFRCAGYERNVTPEMTNDYANLIDVITKDGDYVAKYGVYPLLNKKLKVKANKLAEFISILVAQCKETLVVYNEYLVQDFSEFLRNAAQSGYNDIRHTAIFVAMKLTTALLIIENEDQKMRDRYAEDLQDAAESGQASRMIHMKEKALQNKELYESRLQKINKLTKYLTKEIFANGFRDMCEQIQFLTVEELRVWIQTVPMRLNSLGKYVIQAMVEPFVSVRLAALKILMTGLGSVLAEEDAEEEYEGFFAVALSKLHRRASDISEDVAVLSINLIGKIRVRFPSLKISSEDKRGVANLVYATRQRVARAAGTLLYEQMRAGERIGFVLRLARFHAQNCRDYPKLFPSGTESLLLSAIPSNCAELADWPAISAAMLDSSGPDSHALAVMVAAIVAHIFESDDSKKDSLDTNENRRRMTEIFLGPLVELMRKCEDPETLELYVQIIRAMDAHVLCLPKCMEASTRVIQHLARVSLVFHGRLALEKSCAAALGSLASAGHANVCAIVGTVYRFALTRLEENFCEDTQELLSNELVDQSLCLLAAFGTANPLPDEMAEWMLQILSHVAEDAADTPCKFSQLAHAFAIEALYYDYVWMRMNYEKSTAVGKKAYFLLTAILGFLESKQHPADVTRTVIFSAFDMLSTCSLGVSFPNYNKLFLHIAEYLENNAFGTKVEESHTFIAENRALVVSFFKLLIRGYMDLEHSAVFYRNYATMCSPMQRTIAEVHTFFCRSMVFYGPLCDTVLAGFKAVYVALQQSAADHDWELSEEITRLAETAGAVCSWMAPGKNSARSDYERKGAKLAEALTATVDICIASPEKMAPFCRVLAPFADRLPDSHRKKLLKLVMKGFARMSSQGVKQLVSGLKMKNTEIGKLCVTSAENSQEITSSPIENRRFDRSHYAPLPLRTFKRTDIDLNMSISPVGTNGSEMELSQIEPFDRNSIKGRPSSEDGTDHSSPPKSESSIKKQPSRAKGSYAGPTRKPVGRRKPLYRQRSSMEVSDDGTEHSSPLKPVGHGSIKKQNFPTKSSNASPIRRPVGFPKPLYEQPLLMEVSDDGTEHSSPLKPVGQSSIKKHPSSAKSSNAGPSRKPLDQQPSPMEVSDDDTEHSSPFKPVSCSVIDRQPLPATSTHSQSSHKPGSGKLLERQHAHVEDSDAGTDDSGPTKPVGHSSIEKQPLSTTSSDYQSSHKPGSGKLLERQHAHVEDSDAGTDDSGPTKPVGHSSIEKQPLSTTSSDYQSSHKPGSGKLLKRQHAHVEDSDAGTDDSGPTKPVGHSSIEKQPLSTTSSDYQSSHKPGSGKLLERQHALVEDSDAGTDDSGPTKPVGHSSIEKQPSSTTSSDYQSSHKPDSGKLLKRQQTLVEDSDPESHDGQPSPVKKSDPRPAKPVGHNVSPDQTDSMPPDSPHKPRGPSKPLKKPSTAGQRLGKPAMKALSEGSSHVESLSKPAQEPTSKAAPGQTKSRLRKPQFVPLAIQTSVRQEVSHRGTKDHSSSRPSIDSIHEFPACRLATNYLPAKVITAEDLNSSSTSLDTDERSASDKPAEVSGQDDSQDDGLALDVIRHQSNVSQGQFNKAASAQCIADYNISDMTDSSFENAPTQKRHSLSHAASQAAIGGWSVTANAGSYETNSVHSNTVPQPREGSDLHCDSSDGSSGLDNTPSLRGNSDDEEQEISLATHLGVGSLKDEVESKTYEKLRDELQTLSIQRPPVGLSDPPSPLEDEVLAVDACNSEEEDSEDFIPSSQLGSISSDRKSPPRIASDLDALVSEDESDYEEYSVNICKTEGQFSLAKELVSSPEGVIIPSSPDLGGIGDLPAEDQSDSDIASVDAEKTSRSADCGLENSLMTVADSSSEAHGMGDLVAEDKSDTGIEGQDTSSGLDPSKVATSSPGICGMEDILSEDESVSDTKSVDARTTLGHTGFCLDSSPLKTAALSSSAHKIEDMLPEDDSDSDVESVDIGNGQATEKSGRVSRLCSSPKELDTFSTEIDRMGVMLAETEIGSDPNGFASESECDFDSSESEVPDSGQKALERLVGASQESVRRLSGSLYRDCMENEDQASPPIAVLPSSDMGSLPKSLMGIIKGDDSDKSFESVAGSSAMSPPCSLLGAVESDASMKSPVSEVNSSVTSPASFSKSDIESDASVKSSLCGASSSVTSPPGSLVSDIESDSSQKSLESLAPSSTSPPTSLMSEIESNNSQKSVVSVAPSSVMSPSGSLMGDIEEISVATSSVTSPPGSLMGDIESDGSAQSPVSVATSSVTSPPGSLMGDIESDGSAQSPVSVATSSVTSPPGSLMGDIESDGSAQSPVSVATSSVTSPPGSLMGDIESDGSVQSPGA